MAWFVAKIVVIFDGRVIAMETAKRFWTRDSPIFYSYSYALVSAFFVMVASSPLRRGFAHCFSISAFVLLRRIALVPLSILSVVTIRLGLDFFRVGCSVLFPFRSLAISTFGASPIGRLAVLIKCFKDLDPFAFLAFLVRHLATTFHGNKNPYYKLVA